MIHESGSLSSGKWSDGLRSSTRWKAYRKKGGERKHRAKEKDSFMQGHLRGKSRNFYDADYFLFLWGTESTHVTDYITDIDLRIPD